MGGKSSTISTTEPRLGTLRVQTSMYGLALPLMWGQPRVTGNLLWFGNFQAIAHTTTEEQGGKGGGGGVKQVTTTYTYYAAAMLAIGRGPINGIASAWKDKKRYFGEITGGVRVTKQLTVVVDSAGAVVNVPLDGGVFAGDLGVAMDDGADYYQTGNGP